MICTLKKKKISTVVMKTHSKNYIKQRNSFRVFGGHFN